eukprot:TRINITY_DN31351_c0_g1_i1.p1 TRINITY_DN31351_c0_g1~~TRINITY_DN31351_c0_g1_i1.p1  ORF type:complete len:724 (+),score=150.18 TRINITY_DN31351_c0_g1_i1:53-2173(+)
MLGARDTKPDGYERIDVPQVAEKKDPSPWCRFFVLWIFCSLASGLLPGQALFLDLFADAGVFASVCKDGEAGCKDQYLTITAVFSGGQSVAYMFLMPIGLFYDRWGANLVGTVGAAVCSLGVFTVWISIIGAACGQDTATSSCFAIGVLICDFGSMLNSFSFMGLIWHFPGRQSLVLALIQATYQVSAFLPLAIQFAMDTFGFGFGNLVLVWLSTVLASIFVCRMLVPTQKEYYEQAKKELGMPLPRPPKEIKPCEMFYRAWTVLRLHTCDHAMCAVALSLGFALPSFYSSLIAPYGTQLFGHKADGDNLAKMFVIINGLVGGTLGPISGNLADRFGIQAFILFLAFILLVGFATVGWASWKAQMACSVCLTLFNLLFTLFISRYMLQYSPPNRFGTVNGVYTLLVMLAFMPFLFLGMGITSSLPEGPDAYRYPMYVYGVTGGVGMLAYAVYYRGHPPPDVPPLLPEDELELAKGFGCSSMEEVMEVTNIKERAKLVKLLAKTDADSMKALLHSIDTERMMDVLGRRSVDEMVQMMEAAGEEEEGEFEDEEEQEEASVAPLIPTPAHAVHAAPEETRGLLGGLIPLCLPECVPACSSRHEEERIRARSVYLADVVKSGDKETFKQYMLSEPIDDIMSSAADLERWQSPADRKRTEKNFKKLMSGKDFADLLRKRQELRFLVQVFIVESFRSMQADRSVEEEITQVP